MAKANEAERTAQILRKHGWAFDDRHGVWHKLGCGGALLVVMMEDPPKVLRRLGDAKCAQEIERSYHV